MIQGPLTGATESDAASGADVAALTTVVEGNTTTISSKADSSALTTAEGTISTHTGQLAALNASVNGLGNNFYTKALTDGLLSGKQAVITDADLTIARTSGLQAALDVKAIASTVYTKTASDALLDALPVSFTNVANHASFGNPQLADPYLHHALSQNTSGVTYLNSSTQTRIRVNNGTYINCTGNQINHYKSLVYGSDTRLKFNQRPIGNALATMLALGPRLYEKVDQLGEIPSVDTPTEAGFIAQEVDSIPGLSGCVSRPNDVIDTFGLDYRQLGSPYQVAAIQELSQLVTALTARVAALEAA